MTARVRPTRRRAGLLVCLGFLAAACGIGDTDAELAADAFEGVSITIGSKNFTEQYVLSEILLQALEARGAEVTDAIDTGDTATTRDALLEGDIDAYWEYNSTGWVEHLGLSDPDDDGEELTAAVRSRDGANGIRWLGRSSFNDTYGFAMGPELASERLASRARVSAFDLDAMAEYLEDEDDATVCVEPEFPERDDGLELFEQATGYTIPDSQLRVVDDPADVYPMTATGRCDFGEVFTTNGQIDALDLELVVDPGVFYVYNVSLTIREDVYQQAPDAFDALATKILAPLSQRRMTSLNRQVSDGASASDVAAAFIDEFGIDG